MSYFRICWSGKENLLSYLLLSLKTEQEKEVTNGLNILLFIPKVCFSLLWFPRCLEWDSTWVGRLLQNPALTLDYHVPGGAKTKNLGSIGR